MPMLFEWHRTAMDHKSRSGLPMTGEDTGLGALASPLAGYLGKVQERAASLEYCPWCTSKGLTYALRSYRINLQESITLCTNPQCLFPLVSRSLEDVLASLDPVEPTIGNKRKNVVALEKEELIKPNKHLRSSGLDNLGPQSISDKHSSQAEHVAANVVSHGQRAAPKTDGGKVNGYHRDSPVTEKTRWDSSQGEDGGLEKEQKNAAGVVGLVPPTCSVSPGHLQCSSDTLLVADGIEPARSPHRVALGVSEVKDDFTQVKSPPEALNRRCSLDSSQPFLSDESVCLSEIDTRSSLHNEQTVMTEQKPPAADDTKSKDTQGIKSETGDLSSTAITAKELVPVPNRIFWRNSDNLCWLDSLLVALVNCKNLRKSQPKDEPQQSFIWRLMRSYEDICAAIKLHQQPGRDGVAMVPNHVLQKANADLQSLRMAVFKLLQPKLHCKLGQRETPVFALPLLLTMDSCVEPLFQSTFLWEFECSECKSASKERLVKTLPTLTNVCPDWRPLHANQSAPCNVCRKKKQRRTMVLEGVPPVFVLHFVEGLPDSDVRVYTFTFEGKHYSVTTVIQYNQQLRHFVTWICNSDGLWLEYDDLKHPDCKTHQQLPVPAEEIHIVFWELEEDKEPPACSPSSTLAECCPSKKESIRSPGDKDVTAGALLAPSLDQSLLASHGDSTIVCALTASEDHSNIMDTTVTAAVDTSIGSTTLLDAFEGLSHNDIITLTLVEMKADSEMQPGNGNGQTQDVSLPGGTEMFDSTPDSSSTVIGSEMPHGPVVELPTTSNASEPEDGSPSELKFAPAARGRRGRGRGIGRSQTRQMSKKAASSKAAPHISPSASSEPSKVISNTPARAAPAQDNTPPVETAQKASPVSSTNTSPLSDSQKSPTMLPAVHQDSCWSFLLSKHPLHQVQKLTDKLASTPATQVKPSRPIHSTPNPVKRQQVLGGLFSKPQLKTEDSQGLPPKAAEMYNAFGAKSSSISSPPLPSPTLLNGKSKLCQSITSNQQTFLMNTTVACGTSLPVPGAKGLLEISSSKKHSSRSSKVPEGLSDTEALRYKLMKKLKAKKKKLAKLNEMLSHQGGASLRPDSTYLGSPNTVTSSTYDGSVCDDFLSDLLSPATTASNLSPDSTGFLEMLTSGQDEVNPMDCGVSAADAAPQVNTCRNEPNADNFLDNFLSQAVAQRPTEMETEALSALELFV
ncbi:SUMO-specific isopeptidase USPL1 isoform X2 [Chaetodon trifascialis]